MSYTFDIKFATRKRLQTKQHRKNTYFGGTRESNPDEPRYERDGLPPPKTYRVPVGGMCQLTPLWTAHLDAVLIAQEFVGR